MKTSALVADHPVGFGAVLRAAVIGSLGVALASCGGSQAGRTDLPQGAMPSGGSFTGVWSSPQYGEMHMVQTGANVVGLYRKDEREGRIQGTASGNVLRYQWEEERELVGGRPTRTRGLGYFVYSVGQDERHYIDGRWGLDSDDSGGGPWRAYKLRNRRPRVNSDGTQSTEDGEVRNDWNDDSSGGDSGGSSDDSGGSDDLGDLGDLK